MSIKDHNMCCHYNGYGGYGYGYTDAGLSPVYGAPGLISGYGGVPAPGFGSYYPTGVYGNFGYGYGYNVPVGYGGFGGTGFGFGGWWWIWALLILIVIVLQFGRNFNRNQPANNNLLNANCCDTTNLLGANTACNTNQIDNSVLFIIIIFLLIIFAWWGWGGYGGGFGGGYW